MSTTRARYKNGMIEYYNNVTQQVVDVVAPVKFYDEFLGYQPHLSETGSKAPWLTVEVALNTGIALVAATGNGVLGLIMDGDVNAEDAVLYAGDQLSFNLKALASIQFRAAIATLPTLTGQIVLGVGSAHNLDKDAMTVNAWFKFDGSGDVVCETDDTGTDNDDKASGATTIVAGAYHNYRIDFGDLTSVKFYLDGERVAAATTFDMSTLTDAEALVQPYFSLDKDADAGVGSLYLDSVLLWSHASA